MSDYKPRPLADCLLDLAAAAEQLPAEPRIAQVADLLTDLDGLTYRISKLIAFRGSARPDFYGASRALYGLAAGFRDHLPDHASREAAIRIAAHALASACALRTDRRKEPSNEE